ncbi:ABC transporter permease [Thermoflexibacter ruber]|uniref:Peptide/nickel transport system permease protein n=1 Tax=Thermoflexibacter ruber TaxID=1003 RepID=A0A1I2G312_9BACT|nr:ABC transporter permease [Thermoflexibacter ruber]SFF11529.1 peptide/nickel transport system permease protein [Thermoflexibacter ruber]
MLQFILKRLGYGLLVILGVMLVVFFIFHALPGDPVEVCAGKHPSKEERELLNKEFGFDKPLLVQFFLYLNDFSPLSFHENTPENQKKYRFQKLLSLGSSAFVIKFPYLRQSCRTNRQVAEQLLENLEGTLWLSLSAITLATVLGIFLGLVAALKKGTFTDNFIVTSSVVGFSTPSFVMAILISIIFGYYLADITGLPIRGHFLELKDNGERVFRIKYLILPTITLALRPLAIIIQLTRSAMIEVLSQDYIRTARAKGLPKWRIVGKHALRNALNPVITAVSGWFAALMTGAFFVEYLFNLKGLGYVTIEAVDYRDFPIVIGATVVIAIIFVLINIIVDIIYALTDPRIRLS